MHWGPLLSRAMMVGRFLFGVESAITPAQERAKALLSRSRLSEAVGIGAACLVPRRAMRLPVLHRSYRGCWP